MQRRRFIKQIATSLIGIIMGLLSPTQALTKPEQNLGRRRFALGRLRHIRRELQQVLNETLHAWFPRCLDLEFGNY